MKNVSYVNITDTKQKIYEVNKLCKYVGIFIGLNDWSIILLITSNTINDEKDDMVFVTILKGVDSRISDKIISNMYGSMRKDDENIDEY